MITVSFAFRHVVLPPREDSGLITGLPIAAEQKKGTEREKKKGGAR